MFFMLVVMTLSLTFLSFADPHWLRDTNAILAFPFSIGVVRSIGSIIHLLFSPISLITTSCNVSARATKPLSP